jgi:hypothetical protein
MAEIDYKDKRKFVNTISANASGDDTVKLIVSTINTYANSPFVQDTAKAIKAKSPTKADFLKNLFGVACKNIKYLMDQPGHEVIYTPLLLMKMGKGDCKKFTVFIGAVLKAAGIDGVPKVVKYDLAKDWEHIYIISRDANGGYVTLDPVNHQKFDKEVKYVQARLNYLDGTYSPIMKGNKLSLMGNLGLGDGSDFIQGVNDSATTILDDLSVISGVGCPRRSKYNRDALRGLQEDYMNGVNDENMIYGDEDSMGYSETEMGKRKSKGGGGGRKKAPKKKKTKEEKKARRKKFFKKIKKFDPAMASIRVAFLSLVKMGGALQKMKGLKINMAAHLADAMKDPVKAKPVLDIWEKFGGTKEALMKAIVQAGKSKMHGTDDEAQLMSGLEGMGVAPAVAAAAVITAATPILIPVIKMLKRNKNIPEGQADAIEDGIETAERVAQNVSPDGGFTPEAITTLTKSALVKESARDDNGGDRETVKEMRADAENFQKGDSNAAASPKQYSDTPQGEDIRTAQTANETFLPVKTSDTPQAQGKNMFGSILFPTVWCRIILLVMVLGNVMPGPFINFIGSLAISGLIATTILLFINYKKSNNG